LQQTEPASAADAAPEVVSGASEWKTVPFKKKGILIGIGGGSGSGKTSVAQNIDQALGPGRVCIIEQDFYYRDLSDLPHEERARMNFDHPDAFDMDLLHAQLSELLSGKTIDHPIYDFRNHCRKPETERVGPHRVIVLEGILILMDPRIRNLMDIKVYVDNDPDVRFIRRLRRDIHERGRSVDSVVEQYEKSVRPMYLQFVEPTKRYADIIIPGGGHNRVAIDLLKTKIEALLTDI
jgi:uridine kinase